MRVCVLYVQIFRNMGATFCAPEYCTWKKSEFWNLLLSRACTVHGEIQNLRTHCMPARVRYIEQFRILGSAVYAPVYCTRKKSEFYDLGYPHTCIVHGLHQNSKEKHPNTKANMEMPNESIKIQKKNIEM